MNVASRVLSRSSLRSIDDRFQFFSDEILRRRGSRGYRLVPDVAPVRAHLVQPGVSTTVLRASPEDLSVAWDDRPQPRPGETLSVRVGLREHTTGPLTAQVLGVEKPAGDRPSELALRLVSPPLAEGRRMVGMLDELLACGGARLPETHAAIREPITTGARVREIAVALAREGATGLLRTPSGTAAPVTALRYDADPGRITWRYTGPRVEAPFVLEGHALNSIIWIPVMAAEMGDGVLVTHLPPQILRLRNRWRRRVTAARDSRITFRHPVWPELHILRSLRDVSYSGLSFFADPKSDLVYPGLVLPAVEIHPPGRDPIVTAAEVRSVTTASDGRRVCGVQLFPHTAQVNARWAEAVNDVLHPSTSIGAEWNEATWDLYQASGYFNLSGKEASDFAHMKRAFVELGRGLDGNEHVGFRAVRPSTKTPGVVDASMSVFKLYANSWMGHQMAKRRGQETPAEAKQVLRDIYLRAMEPLQADPTFEYLFGYCEGKVRWMHAAHTEFALPYEAKGTALARPFRLMEGSTARGAFPVDARFAVGEATAEEQDRLLDRVAATRPAIYGKALDLLPGRLGLDRSRDNWETAGLDIARTVLAVRRDGRALVAAVVESTEPGTNLFHLLDSVRLFPLADDVAPAELEAAMEQGLRAAADWLRGQGHERFVYFCEDGEGAHTAGLQDLGEGRLWIISRHLLPEYLDHIHRLTV